MSLVVARSFRLKGRLVVLICGLLILFAGMGIYGEGSTWKGGLVIAGGLPLVLTAIFLRNVELGNRILRINIWKKYFDIEYEKYDKYEHRHFLGSWNALFIRTKSYPFWAWPFFFAINPLSKGVVLNPNFLAEFESSRTTICNIEE